MGKEENWLDTAFKLHEQSHLYWKHIFTIQILIVGWSATVSSIDPILALIICFFVVLAQTLLGQAAIKFYMLLMAAVKEYKIKNEGNDDPFIVTIRRLYFLKYWHLIVINIFLVITACSAVIYASIIKAA